MAEQQKSSVGENLISLMTDFPNKFIYYPMANLWYIPFSYTPITPTQVTIVHTIMAFVGAWFLGRGSVSDLWIAFAIFQVRAVLDCLDGTIARRKNMSSELGRNLDMLGDSIGFLCLMTGYYFFMRNHNYGILETVGTLFMSTLISGIMAQGTDHYRRKFSAALREGKDTIVEEIQKKHNAIAGGKGTFLLWFSYLNDWFQILVLNPGSIGRLRAYLKNSGGETEFVHDVETIRGNLNSPKLKFAMFMVGMLSGDVAIFILLMGFPFAKPVEAMYVNMAYGVLMIAVVGIVMARFFGSAAKQSTAELPVNPAPAARATARRKTTKKVSTTKKKTSRKTSVKKTKRK
ncbi:MAG: CDP-alcohol phosphatidyltransferase family protein [Spirochaetes bacterium]|nr:CDP-alcohol phosphatidyltransferase family protein [Spirochaetota bacterium]